MLEPDHIIGFINGTLIEGDKLTHESMKKHKKEGSILKNISYFHILKYRNIMYSFYCSNTTI